MATACSGNDAERESTDEISADSIQAATGAVPLRLSPRVGNLAKMFNDMNDAHIDVAGRIGISPIRSLRDAWNLHQPLEEVTTCSDFVIDSLTHSFPYLVPDAARLLHDIGRTFRDSLQARGGGDYRIIVTSVLRTEESVNRLRRRNINSTENSAHLYGTTFDVSYVRFLPADSVGVERREGDLKNMLAEVLLDMRENGRCLVKYERKQGCFHITASN